MAKAAAEVVGRLQTAWVHSRLQPPLGRNKKMGDISIQCLYLVCDTMEKVYTKKIKVAWLWLDWISWLPASYVFYTSFSEGVYPIF